MIDIEKYVSRYDHCELTLCLLKDKQDGKFYNFFSLIDLIPVNQFPSEWIQKNTQRKCLSISEKYDFIIDKIKLDTKNALEYYSTDSVHFISGNKNYERIYDFGKYAELDCGDQGILIHTDWQNTESVLNNLIPKYRVNTRVFYKICLNSELREILVNEKFKNCFSSMNDYLNISFYDKREYWGAYLICLPDYLLQDIDIKLGKNKDVLLVNIFPRKSKKIENLTLLLSDEQRNGTGFFFSKPLESNYTIIPLPQKPDTLHTWIYHICSDGSIELLEEQRSKFVKNISLGMSIKESDITYQLADKTVTAEGNTYISSSIIGENDTESQKLVNENEERRYLEKLDKKKIFMYFDGTKEKKIIAKQTIKELLQSVKKKCIVCDPYFSMPDFENYILPITGRNCLIQIITTENKLSKTKKGDAVDKSAGYELERMLEQLDSVFANRSKIECYVLNNTPDDKTLLHDRFFIIDETAYLIGSSLNHFGEKATTLYKTPSAKILQREADIMIKNKSLLLSDWLTK